MRRQERVGQAGTVGSKTVADARMNVTYRPFADRAGQDATAAERAHLRGAESLELVVVAGDLLESSKELLHLSHAQIRRFTGRRQMSLEDLARRAKERRSS